MGRRIPPEQLLSTPARRRIYDRIGEVPGIHLRQLQRELTISLGSLEYHLHRLLGGGLLVTRGTTHVKAYFHRNQFDRRDCDYLYCLRQDMPRRIAIEVLNRPDITFQELVARLPIGPSSTSFHVRRMIRASILLESPQGRSKSYRLADEDRARRLVLRYRQTFTDDVVDRFASAWLDIA